MKKFRFILIIGMVFATWHLSSSFAWGIWYIQKVDWVRDVGRYTSLALDSSGYPHISYYDVTWGYLKYAVWDGRSWDIRTVDYAYGGDVGKWTSLALDSSDYPHISYYDQTNGDLKYAVYDGRNWDIQKVDWEGDVGWFTSIALDSSNHPRISYYDETNGDLKYAVYDGRNWGFQWVDRTRYRDVGWYTSLALDSSGYPHISYYHATWGNLKYAVWDGMRWDIRTVDWEEDVGHWTSLALDSSGYPHISYHDQTNEDLKYAVYDGRNWDIQTVDWEGDVGDCISLALDSSDYPHISYWDGTNFDLKYAWYDGRRWYRETVDSEGEGYIGWYTSLALDSSDYPHISYRNTIDGTHGNLRYAWSIPMEVGQATVNHNWTMVNLTKSFINPVIIAKPLSYNGSDPAAVRIKYDTSSSFKIRVQEWNYLDGSHALEKVNYLVIEKGSGIVDGRRLEAGFLFTARCGTSSFASVSFSSSFSTVPVILSSVGSFNASDTVVTRIKQVTKTGFKLTMQEQEANVQHHSYEEWIYWIAWEPGTGTIDGIDYQVGKTGSVTHNLKEISTNFGCRYLWVDEETSLDAETSHAAETVGWMAFSGSSLKFLADMQTTNGSDPANLRYSSLVLETGEVSLDHTWKKVSLTKSFTNPVVVAKPLSYSGSGPAAVRIKDVDPSAFMIRVQEWDYLDGTHTTETVSYLVVEEGSWTVDGRRIEARSFSTNSCGTTSFAREKFADISSTVPVILSSVGTFNGEDTVVTRVKNVTTTGFKLTMQEQEKNTQVHTTEKIYWIAWDPGSGTIGGKAYQVAKATGINHTWRPVGLSWYLASTPALLVDLQTTNDPDPANLRYKDKTKNAFRIHVNEEKSKDSETTHANENIGYVAIFSRRSASLLQEEKIPSLPLEISQALNYPNPFHSETAFSFSLTRSAEVTIKVYTVAGELVKTIGSTPVQAGYQELSWDGKNDRGDELANGVYLYQIIANSGKETANLIKKLAVLR